jgi:hypothetical protein
VYGGSVAQTAIPLGTTIGSPSSLATTVFELAIFCSSYDTAAFYMQLTNVNTGASLSTTLFGASTVVPQATTLLAWRAWKTNNATAAAAAYDLCSLYIETEI